MVSVEWNHESCPRPSRGGHPTSAAVEDDISEEIRLARAALFSTGLIVLDTKHSQMVPARIDARSVVIASAYNMLAAVHGDKL